VDKYFLAEMVHEDSFPGTTFLTNPSYRKIPSSFHAFTLPLSDYNKREAHCQRVSRAAAIEVYLTRICPTWEMDV